MTGRIIGFPLFEDCERSATCHTAEQAAPALLLQHSFRHPGSSH